MSTTATTKWFVQFRGLVQGPFTSETLPQTLQQIGDDNLDQALVWKRGLSEWIRAHQWQKADQKIAQQAATQNPNTTRPQTSPARPASANVVKDPAPKPDLFKISPTPGQQTQVTRVNQAEARAEMTKTVTPDNDLFEKTFTQAFSEDVFYRVQLNFVDQPMMTKNELMQLIATQEDVSAISIQDPKTKDWKEIYAFPDLVEKFGISRRTTLRVPILAQFSGNTNKAKNVSYRVITISEGGFGFTENFDLKIGDEVDGQITSPHFFQPLRVKAEVVYSGLDGYIGLKFGQLADETKAAVIDYVKKFGKTKPKT